MNRRYLVTPVGLVSALANACWKHSFLVTLVFLLLAGVVWHVHLDWYARILPRQFIVAGVLFLMSVTLETRAMFGALRRPGPVLWSVCLNAIVAPPLAYILSQLVRDDLQIGLIIAASVPSTMASAAVWTRRAGGNDAIPLLVTMVTNLGSFLVLPFWIATLVGTESHVEFGVLVTRLVLLVVIPIVIGQILRRFAVVRQVATDGKGVITRVAQVGILAIVLAGAIASGARLLEARLSGIPVSYLEVGALLLVALILHIVLFALGMAGKRLGGFSRADTIGVAMSGSQKTLMIGLDMALVFGGLAILPMVVYHLLQLVVDTMLADRLRRGEGERLASDS